MKFQYVAFSKFVNNPIFMTWKLTFCFVFLSERFIHPPYPHRTARAATPTSSST